MSASRRFPIDPWALSPPKNDPVEMYLDVLVRHLKVREVILFGARATGANMPRGPVDLALRCRRLGRGEFARIVRGVREEARTLIQLRVVNLNGANEALRAEIERTGRTIYSAAWKRFGSVGPFDGPQRTIR